MLFAVFSAQAFLALILHKRYFTTKPVFCQYFLLFEIFPPAASGAA
jgi:hypothetical protein